MLLTSYFKRAKKIAKNVKNVVRAVQKKELFRKLGKL